MPLTERSRKWWFQTPAVVRGCLPHLQGAQAVSPHQFLDVDPLVGLRSWLPTDLARHTGFELRKPCGPRGLLGMTGPAHRCGWCALRRQEAQPPCFAVPGCRSSRGCVSCGTSYGKGPKLGAADTRYGVANRCTSIGLVGFAGCSGRVGFWGSFGRVSGVGRPGCCGCARLSASTVPFPRIRHPGRCSVPGRPGGWPDCSVFLV